MGWYGGDGGRLVHTETALAGIEQAACTQPTGEDVARVSVECDWGAGHPVAIPATWTSGAYLAKLRVPSTNYQAYVPFVVREDARPATLLYQTAVMNYHAYNRYPGHQDSQMSFYTENDSGETFPLPWEKRLSFDRPYGSTFRRRNAHSPFSYHADGSASFFTWDFPMIQWLEQEGYDVTYATNIDVHVGARPLTDSKGILSVGHDEYWSDEMATAVSAARDAGVNLGLFGGNQVFGTVQMQPSFTGGRPNRVMEGLSKAWRPVDNYGAPPNDDQWDSDDGPGGYYDKRKRQALLGQANTGCCVHLNLDWTASDAATDHRVFDGTGISRN